MLTCTSCGSANPAGHRFCGACGTPLAVACPACGTSAPPGSRFCGACGSALDAAATAGAAGVAANPPAPATERRVCSVLFADLVGFTPLSEARDPEEVRDLLSRYFETARTVISRYGGVVEKFIGDAVMAVWGTPVASEGDAERAVRAGLDLVAAIDVLGGELATDGLALRAGVVTGEVAATLGAEGQGMVAGDAVNTAARVQAAARPGTVWVDDATHRLAGAAIGFTDAGSHELKGKAAAVRLWQATRVLSSVGGAQRVDGLEGPMVGRAAEERTLRELFHACADRRSPRLVTITGDAGLGKTRLGWEFEKYIDGLAEIVWWHRGRCLSYGDGIAFWALAEAVRQRFEIADEDPTDVATSRFVTRLGELVPDPGLQEFVGIRLGRLLGLTHPADTGEPLSRDELFTGWRQFLELLAVSGPVLLLVEDAQHADEGLLDFLVHVAEWSRQAPIFVVTFARGELVARRPDLIGGRNRSSLSLDPLDEQSMRSLVCSLVHDVPADDVAKIAAQAQGNPLFAVETIRSLVDRDIIVPLEGEYRLVGDVGTLTVPDSLHGLLAARLDALDPALRSLVADAAVVGSTFPAEALAAVSGRPAADVVASLGELVRREILDVTDDPLSPQRGGYAFSQHLLRQVAYDTLSRRDRRARHLAVARHLQLAFADGGEEIMEVVARHYLDALAAAPGEDDAEVRGRAFDCLVRGAERSRRSGAQLQAARSFEQAATLVETTDPAAAARLLEQAQEAYANDGRSEPALAAGTRARELFMVLGDTRAAARTDVSRGLWLLQTRRLPQARETLDAALEELRDDPDADTVTALARLVDVLTFSGELGRAGELADEALQLAQAVETDDRGMADVFGAVGVLRLFAQRTTEAILFLRHAADLAERAGDTVQHARALLNLANLYLGSDVAAASGVARDAVALSQRVGSRRLRAAALSTLAEAMLLAGDWTDAHALLAEEAGPATDLDPGISEDVTIMVAILHSLRGDVESAMSCAALPETRGSEEVQDLAWTLWVDAELALVAGDPARALTSARRLFDDGTAFVDFWSTPVLCGWPLAVRCAFELGRLDEVRELVDVLAAKPAGHVPALLRSERALARARLAEADGEGVELVDAAYAHALVRCRAAGSPFHLAHALLDHAVFRQRNGLDARALLDEAAALGERLGAAGVLRRVRGVPLPTPGAW